MLRLIFGDLLPGNQKKLLLFFGYPKRNDFKKREYLRFWKRLGTKWRNNNLRNGNVPKISKKWKWKWKGAIKWRGNKWKNALGLVPLKWATGKSRPLMNIKHILPTSKIYFFSDLWFSHKKGSMNPALSTFLKYVFANYVFTLYLTYPYLT